jgi:hypothetical protein
MGEKREDQPVWHTLWFFRTHHMDYMPPLIIKRMGLLLVRFNRKQHADFDDPKTVFQVNGTKHRSPRYLEDFQSLHYLNSGQYPSKSRERWKQLQTKAHKSSFVYQNTFITTIRRTQTRRRIPLIDTKKTPKSERPFWPKNRGRDRPKTSMNPKWFVWVFIKRCSLSVSGFSRKNFCFVWAHQHIKIVKKDKHIIFILFSGSF